MAVVGRLDDPPYQTSPFHIYKVIEMAVGLSGHSSCLFCSSMKQFCPLLAKMKVRERRAAGIL